MSEDLDQQLNTIADATRRTHPNVFLAYGPHVDIDEAFDEAAAGAGAAHGYTGAHPSLAAADSSTLTERGDLLPAPAAAHAAAHDLRSTDLEPGVVYAYPVAVASAFTRRRARLTLTDTDLVVPAPGAVGVISDELRAAVIAGLAEAGAPLLEAEVIESLEVVRARPRFKAIVEAFRTKATSSYVLLDPATSTIVASGFATPGLARREAIARAKDGPLSAGARDPELGALEVWKITGREDGNPLLRIARTRIKAATVVKVVLATEKDSAKTRSAGWLFAGIDPTAPDNDDVEADVVAGEAT